MLFQDTLKSYFKKVGQSLIRQEKIKGKKPGRKLSPTERSNYAAETALQNAMRTDYEAAQALLEKWAMNDWEVISLDNLKFIDGRDREKIKQGFKFRLKSSAGEVQYSK